MEIYRLIFVFVFFIIPFCWPNCSADFSRIPVRSFLFLSKQKFMPIEIEGRSYLALIDTGSSRSFMRKDVLNEIYNKTYVSDSDFINIYGNKYLTSNFQISEVQIGSFVADAIFKEEHENFLTDCVVESNPFISWKVHLLYQVCREAIIGMDILQKFCCIFDFPHSSIYLSEEMDQMIGNNDFLTAEWHMVPFDFRKSGVVLRFETNLGEKRLLLDAGSTLSILRFTDEEKAVHQNKISNQTFASDVLKIHDLDFGSWAFKIMDISKEMDDIDGLLGIEFFNRNIIGFDFRNGIAYIQSPKLGSKERFTYWLKSCLGK